MDAARMTDGRPSPSRRRGARRWGCLAALAALILPFAALAADEAPDALSALREALSQTRAVAAPKACATGDVEAGLSARMTGFAREAGTTGGAGRPRFAVTRPDDARDAPEGTLRHAVEAARTAGGGWIDLGALPGDRRRVELAASLALPSNVTLDGGCGGAAIMGPPDKNIVVIRDVSNVVVARVTLRPSTPAAAARGDCVSIIGSDKVWIAFSDFSGCGDGLVDVVRRGLSDQLMRVTIANNRFSDHKKDVLVSDLGCAERPELFNCGGRTMPPWDWAKGVQVTLRDNVFDATAQRHPRMRGQVYVHLDRNLIAFGRWTSPQGEESSSYGAFVGAAARLYATCNVFAALEPRDRRAIVTSLGDKEGVGASRAIGSILLGGASVQEANSEHVPPPPYGADDAPSQNDVLATARRLLAAAGPAGFDSDPVDCGSARAAPASR